MIKLRQISSLLLATTTLVATQQNISAQDELTLSQNDYSIPAWNQLLRQIAAMPSANAPYSINMTINGDPSTRMAFAWFTNPSEVSGKVQIIAKANATEEDFENSPLVFDAVAVQVSGLNYSTEKNNLDGIIANKKTDYTSHKAIATGLTPSTNYSFRVGTEESWSPIGSFTTASGQNDETYSFIYITDTQAQNDQMFGVSQKTVHTAVKEVPEAAFVLCNGDLVETSGDNNSEWEYEQWFSTMQDVWLNKPLVVTMGNHDKSNNGNFGYHFNNSTAYNDNADVKTTMDGTVFSFVRGDVLYMVISYEDYAKEGFLDSLSAWMRKEVAAHKDVKWKVASFHKNMFTGSKSHQDDADGKAVRAAMLPVFDELGIDIAFQGHDHIYEVIGPVMNLNKTLIADAVESVETVGEGGERENMTGKAGGTFDVSNGTLYFLNNSAGKKKYEPRNEEEMVAAYDKHEIENYWGLFSGKFGQTGEPTFSKVEVSPEAFIITTYTVSDEGSAEIFDTFEVVKSKSTSVNNIAKDNVETNIFSRDNESIYANGIDCKKMEIYSIDGKLLRSTDNATISTSGIQSGIYIVKAQNDKKTYSAKIDIA